jgi:TolB protein
MKLTKKFFEYFLVILFLMLIGCGATGNNGNNIPLDGRGGGVIAFSINENDIYSINGDGTGLLQLTNRPGPDSGPGWSPDGNKIAFYSQINSKTWSLFIMNADGSNIKRITFDSNVNDNQPSWTPDGRILFAREYPLQNNKTEVWIVNPDGSDLNRIAEDGSYPSCSNDGTKVVYPVYSDGDGEIWVMNLDGSNKVKITNNQSQDWLPAWSPISDQIVFQSDRDGNHEIYIMNSNGSNVQRLTNNSFYDGYPRWSPDGSKIIFESKRDGHYEIYKMNVDGSNQERLTFTDGNAFQPDWKSKN